MWFLMVNFRDYCEDFWSNIGKHVDRKYIVSDGKLHFIRERKVSLESIIKYPFYDCGRTTAVESINFIRHEHQDKNMTVSKSDISKRRRLLKEICYIDMNKDFIDGIYNDPEGLETFKGKFILAGDTSICDAPNIGYTEKELKALNNPNKNRLKKELIRFRVSCIADALSDFILVAEIQNRHTYSEIQLAMRHLDYLNEKMNMHQTITTYDRGYAALELMLKHMTINSFFLIRLKSDDFNNERKYMKTDDEIIEININSNRTQNFHDELLKEKAYELGRIPVRITEIELINKKGKKYTEILATNLPFDEYPPEILKELYRKRWKIETNFDRLKNIIHLENFSGYSEEIILQDFYANIFMFNFLMAMKLDADRKVKEKHKDKNLKHEYKTNLNVLYGLIKLDMPDLLSHDPKKRSDAVDRILKIAESNLVAKDVNNDRNPDRIVKDPTNKFPPTQRRGE